MIEKVLRIIDSKRDEVVEFTQSLVRTRSENPPGNESAIAALIVKKLKEYGIDQIEIREKVRDRPNVIALVKGQKERPILLYNGHMDTKPPGDLASWRFDPFSGDIRKGAICGLGAADMKGGLAAMVMSAAAMMEANIRLKGSVLLTFVADEENGSINGSRWLVDREYIKADAGLVAEPSGIDESFEYLNIASMGILAFDIIAHGTQMHSGVSNRGRCVNACLKLSELLVTMSREFRLDQTHQLYPKGPIMNLGALMNGGVQYGVVPGTCTAGNDIRLVVGMTSKETEQAVRAFIKRLKERDPDLAVEIQVKAAYEPVETSPEESVVRSTVKAAQRVLNFTPKLAGMTATDDASFFIRGAGIPTIPAFGPGLASCAHKPNETVKIKDVVDAAKIYSLLALDYLGAARLPADH